MRARALEVSGNPRAALNVWRRYREPQKLTMTFFGVGDRIVAFYEMGRLAEQLGDTAAARQHFKDFLDHWGDVDMPVASVDDARARLAALGD